MENISLMYGYIKNKVRQILTLEQQKQKNLLSEGLIMTHNINKVNYHLQKFWSNNFRTSVNLNNNVFVLFPKTKEKTGVDGLIKYMNNMGYFLSAFIKNDEFIKVGDNLTDYDGLRFEPKFDMEVEISGRYLYHITDKKHLNKILEIGLTPKTKSKLTHYPERIYLTTNKDDSNQMLNNFLEGGFIKDPVMLEIDIDGLYNKFLEDKQFEGAVYTIHNIPSSHIKVVEN